MHALQELLWLAWHQHLTGKHQGGRWRGIEGGRGIFLRSPYRSVRPRRRQPRHLPSYLPISGNKKRATTETNCDALVLKDAMLNAIACADIHGIPLNSRRTAGVCRNGDNEMSYLRPGMIRATFEATGRIQNRDSTGARVTCSLKVWVFLDVELHASVSCCTLGGKRDTHRSLTTTAVEPRLRTPGVGQTTKSAPKVSLAEVRPIFTTAVVCEWRRTPKKAVAGSGKRRVAMSLSPQACFLRVNFGDLLDSS